MVTGSGLRTARAAMPVRAWAAAALARVRGMRARRSGSERAQRLMLRAGLCTLLTAPLKVRLLLRACETRQKRSCTMLALDERQVFPARSRKARGSALLTDWSAPWKLTDNATSAPPSTAPRSLSRLLAPAMGCLSPLSLPEGEAPPKKMPS
eukprot:CAMPEP_0180033082 /NCGR_PEP_ID=MMETSP0984-20121128/28829_1 /TAXON_ID=483367 /ORGANISM="non described non described, Strain CCMP 2436" /LENGTH=151 /DNA_ID=CAMNT_0021958417 /DNA_START=66 /DNA_END=518 /DNA_ORIENTATION=-